jgi:hypothetical protein
VMRQISQNKTIGRIFKLHLLPQHIVYCVVLYCRVKMPIFVTVAHEIGSGCEYDEQCSSKLGKAVCTNNQCRCAAGTSLKADNTCGKFHT